MRRGVALLLVAVACGGRILDDADGGASDDASVDVAKDAPKDVAAPFDVVGIDDIAVKPTCGIPTQGLLAHYPLDQDTGDHTGHGFDALGTNLTPAAGRVDGAMHFDGATSSMRVVSGAGTLSGARTLCAWSRGSPTAGLGEPIFWGGATGQGDFYSIFSSAPSGGTCPGTPPNVPFVDHWGHSCYFAPTPPVAPATWDFVCYAYDGVSLRFYVDGSDSPPVPGSLYDYAMTTLYVGSTLGNGTTTQGSFDGDLDEVTVWSTPLADPQMNALWNGGLGCAVE